MFQKREVRNVQGHYESIITIEKTEPEKISQDECPPGVNDHIEDICSFSPPEECVGGDCTEFIILQNMLLDSVVRIVQDITLQVYGHRAVFHDELIVWIVAAPVSKVFFYQS